MKKVIEVELSNKEDLFEKYNSNKVSKELLDYIISEVPFLDKNDTIEVIINNRIKNQKETIPYIINGLKEEYNNSINKYDQNNIKQLSYLIIGVITLSISVLIDGIVLKELASVGVWVLFWNVIEIELFEDKDIRKKKKKLQRLLDSEFIEK